MTRWVKGWNRIQHNSGSSIIFIFFMAYSTEIYLHYLIGWCAKYPEKSQKCCHPARAQRDIFTMLVVSKLYLQAYYYIFSWFTGSFSWKQRLSIFYHRKSSNSILKTKNICDKSMRLPFSTSGTAKKCTAVQQRRSVSENQVSLSADKYMS